MASLQVRSPLRSAHPLFLNKIVSLTAFLVLLCLGWVALSYLKSDLVDRARPAATETAIASKSAAVPVKESASAELRPIAAAARLVYSCVDDKEYYHASTHLSARCDRTALSEEAATARGLKRCKACFPD